MPPIMVASTDAQLMSCCGLQASDKENTEGGDQYVRESAGSKGGNSTGDAVVGSTAQDRWARHCHSTLGAVAAASILKASNGS